MAAMSPPSNWPRNRLLLALPARNLKQLLPELEHIRCQREQVLLDADSSLDSIFFLDSGVVSVMAVYSGGGTIEMATIGREGCTGVQAVFGAKNFSARFLVHKVDKVDTTRPRGSHEWRAGEKLSPGRRYRSHRRARFWQSRLGWHP